MKKKEIKDAAGRTLILWDRLPGKLSISVPGEGGFIFIADRDKVIEIIGGLSQWLGEQYRKEYGDAVDEEETTAALQSEIGLEVEGGWERDSLRHQ